MNALAAYCLHDAMNVNRKVSLTTMGKMTDTELRTIIELYPKSDSRLEMYWPAKLNKRDLDLAKKYNFDARLATDVELLNSANSWFVGFGFCRLKEIEALAIKYFPKLKNLPKNLSLDSISCGTFFAHKHNDTGLGDSRGKVVFVVDNPIGHSLFSKDKSRVEHVCTPKAGEILFLDTHCDHAVFPNTSLGFDKMIKNPMKLFMVSAD